ncbi:MAG: FHIPEP family type III secretion protein, partial [Planctomycetales bacterium]|nr:FHIPEP family type III secretion protein [Planctomycetales bacterium]
TKLTIGDGLASQIPAFLIALAAAMLMTRSTRRTELPVEFVRQLVAHPAGLIFAAFFLGLLSLTKLPTVPLMALGAGCLGIAYVLHWPGRAVDEDEDEEESSGAAPLERTDGKRIEDYLSVEPLEVEIGVGLIDLADPQRGGDLMQRVTSLRRRVASERGIVLPKVRIRDNLRLPEVGYRILIHGNPIGRGVLETDRWLAIAKNATAESLDGEETRDPASGERAYWITNSQREYAESHEYRVESPSAVLIEHLHRIANQHADELLSRETTRQLIDEVRQASPTVVEEVISDTLKLGDVQRVLQRLLREGVPIRPLVGILEALADVSRHTHDLDEMVEHTRACLARTITQQYRDSQGRVYAASLDSQLEQQWVDLGRAGSDATSVPLDQEQLHVLVGELGQLMATLRIAGRPEVLLVHPAIRRRVRDVVTPHLPNLRVVSHSELTSDTTVRSVGVARAKLRSRS